jgi:hypothetical protein
MEIRRITIQEIGPVPRNMKRIHRAAAKTGYTAAATAFHERFAALRFTVSHAQAAGYKPRSGANLPYGSKAYWRSYVGRKQMGGMGRPATTAPLVWTGETRDAARMATIDATSNRGTARYTLRKLNWIPWAREEFVRLLEGEANALGHVFNRVYDTNMQSNRDVSRITI